MTKHKKLHELFDYLSAPEDASLADRRGAIVFGRKDPLVAAAMVDAMHDKNQPIDWAVVSGGTGKDSGDLQIPEAEYLARAAEDYADENNVSLSPFYLETQATNGGENVRYSFDVMRRAGLIVPGMALVGVAHATSLRRLVAMVDHERQAHDGLAQLSSIGRVPTQYEFDPTNPSDEAEAVGEMKRLRDWPAKGWLGQRELPADLVDFVSDQYPD